MKEKCEKCKKEIKGSIVVQESLKDILHYHIGCFQGKNLSSFSVTPEVMAGVAI